MAAHGVAPVVAILLLPDPQLDRRHVQAVQSEERRRYAVLGVRLQGRFVEL